VPAVRLATSNLLHGMALDDGTAEPELLAAAARELDPDVLALQEVDRGQPRSGGVDQVAVVADAVGATWYHFVPTVLGTPGPRGWRGSAGSGDASGPAYGIALVSRLPVTGAWVRQFAAAPGRLPLLVPDPRGRPRFALVPDEPRAALAVVVVGPNGPFTVVATHLSFVPGFNVYQLRTITRWAAGWPRPRFLLGDLNLPGRVPALVSGWRSLVHAATYPSYAPRVQLDHVLADGYDARPDARVAVAGAHRLRVSDHCALTADVDP
jgi:endonuclease/exonuclease/phosphatase family metal-dependent hydrolase